MRPRLLQPKTCPVCKVEFRPKMAKQQFCSRECAREGSRGKHRTEEAVKRMRQANKLAAQQRNQRHQARRRRQPTPEQRAALMREYVLDMRAAEKHARLGG